MPRPRKHKDLYGAQNAYRQTEKGRETLRRYNATDAAKASKRDWKRKHDGTIIDKRRWFIDTYGDPAVAFELLNQREKLVIKYFFGLDGGPPLTQKAIASLMECSPQWVSEIKKSALKKLAPTKKAIENKPQQEK